MRSFGNDGCHPPSANRPRLLETDPLLWALGRTANAQLICYNLHDFVEYFRTKDCNQSKPGGQK